MTISEYMTYEAPPGLRDELLEGELILSPSANARHADLCHRLLLLLEQRIRPGYVVRQDTTMLLNEEEEKGNRPRPDVFVIDERRWNEAREGNSYPTGSPQLAVEVLSPSTERVDRESKTPKYLAAGSLAVWLVDGDLKRITVVTHEGSREVAESEKLYSPAELCFEHIAVSRIFSKKLR
jgi:Uma2 family endonuclease